MANHSTHPATPFPIVEYGDNFIPVIPVDYLEHTITRPFCWDKTCPCHDDIEAIAQINTCFQAGLCTFIEAMHIINGEQLC